MSGSRAAGAVFLCACALALGGKNSSYAIVEGTVFRDPGFAVPEAKVTLQARGEAKSKKQEATTNYRGEFEFRVPAVQAVYVVRAAAKGYRPDEKEASITGGGVPGSERVDVNLVLSPESK